MDQIGNPQIPTHSAKRRFDKGIAALTIALAVSVALNVFLSSRVRGLTQGQLVRSPDRLLKAGTAVPPITAKRLDGQPEVISYDVSNEPTVFYVFTPSCSWCARNLDNFKTLVNNENKGYRFIGVSLTEQGLSEYVRKNDLNLPVYSGLSSETLKTYKLGSTPQTIVVSPEGKVRQNWVGAYVGSQKKEIEAFFQVTLPGVRDLPKTQPSAN